jgi:hypothetical protein
MATTVCKVLGVVFLLVGCIGFAKPDLLGAHLTPPHNAVHIISGVIALYFGFAGSLSGAKAFSLVFGVVYLALGNPGLALGGGAGHMWEVGPLHLGKLITAFIFYWVSYFWLEDYSPKPHATV